MDAYNYVAAYGSGYVVLVAGVWYGPGCVAKGSSGTPPNDAIWSDLVAAQNCYNAKHGGTPPPPGTQPPPGGTQPPPGTGDTSPTGDALTSMLGWIGRHPTEAIVGATVLGFFLLKKK